MFIAQEKYIQMFIYLIQKFTHYKFKNIKEKLKLSFEAILNAIRDSLPIEDILRNYMDETVEEDVIETVEEEKIESKEPIEEKETIEKDVKDEINNAIKIQTDELKETQNDTVINIQMVVQYHLTTTMRF